MLQPSEGSSGVDTLRPARIARLLGTTSDTVTSRLDRMEAAGVVVGYAAVPNLRLLGLESGTYLFRAADEGRKADALAVARKLGGLITTHDYFGSGVCLELSYRNAEDRDARLAAVGDACEAVEVCKFFDGTSPDPVREPSRLDWRILAALREQPLATHVELARSLGVTPRTVRRRIARLDAEGAIQMQPLLDPSRADGLILTELFLHLDDAPAAARRVVSVLRDRHVFAYVPATRSLGEFSVLVFAHSMMEVDALVRDATSVEGVQAAEPWFFRRFVDESAWIGDALRERAASAPR